MLKSGFESWLPSHHVRSTAHPFVMGRLPRYTRDEVLAAVRRSESLSQVLRELGLRQSCERCGEAFHARRRAQRYRSISCARRASEGVPRLATRKVVRPPRERLLEEVARYGFCGTGRRYGVSDNAIRKWLGASRTTSGN